MNVSMLQTSPTSGDLRAEAELLRKRVLEAEQQAEAARATPADAVASALRGQLEMKKEELAEAERAEGAVAAARARDQELQVLAGVENDQRATHALLRALRAESVNLAQRLALTEHRHNQLLRCRAELRTKLGIC